MANAANVTNEHEVAAMVQQAVDAWGRVDILINNAGILCDRSFAKMSLDDWRAVVDVHLNGSAYCSHAVWPFMREQRYGRIVMTTLTSGIYGNFGQANYGAAKFGVVGLMNVLCIEGAKYNIYVNSLAPTAATRMTEDVIPQDMLDELAPEHVTPAVLFMASENAPNRKILLAGAGVYTVARLIEGKGVKLPQDQRTPENIAALFEKIDRSEDTMEITEGIQHVERIVKMPLN
jgi:NAD(P)-dependent dehydrogenase (short-subunit alcohol dehydrogenase family)